MAEECIRLKDGENGGGGDKGEWQGGREGKRDSE